MKLHAGLDQIGDVPGDQLHLVNILAGHRHALCQLISGLDIAQIPPLLIVLGRIGGGNADGAEYHLVLVHAVVPEIGLHQLRVLLDTGKCIFGGVSLHGEASPPHHKVGLKVHAGRPGGRDARAPRILLVLDNVSGENTHTNDCADTRNQRDQYRTVLHEQAAFTAVSIFFHPFPPFLGTVS